MHPRETRHLIPLRHLLLVGLAMTVATVAGATSALSRGPAPDTIPFDQIESELRLPGWFDDLVGRDALTKGKIATPDSFVHGISLMVDGEPYVLAGAPDGPGGVTDIPGHYWLQVGPEALVGLHFNTGPFDAARWWSSSTGDGALLYYVEGDITPWSPEEAARRVARGYQHYHELVNADTGELHPSKVLWLRHSAVRPFLLDGGPDPAFGHRVRTGLDRDFVPNWYDPYGMEPESLAAFQHGITVDVDGVPYYLDGAPDGPGGATDIPGHSWMQVSPRVLIGLHFNTGPAGAAQWWSSDVPDGTLLYTVFGIIEDWSETRASLRFAQGFQHYHELVSVATGEEHPNKVLWLRHTAVQPFMLDGGPMPALAHKVLPGVDRDFVPNWMMAYGQEGNVAASMVHGVRVLVDGEDYVLDGAPDGVNGRTDIPGHFWRWAGTDRLAGLHFNTGPAGAERWWSSDADDGALLYTVFGVIDTWTESNAAWYAARGFQHYHELVSLDTGEHHPTKVLWLRHRGVTDFTLDGGPAPQFGHPVTAGLDPFFPPNWFMAYEREGMFDQVFEHGITFALGGRAWNLDGAADGPDGETDIPGHSWLRVGNSRFIGLHVNTGPFGEAQWWSSDADDGALLYYVEGILDTWSEDKAQQYADMGFQHYHELVDAETGELHPDTVLWLRHVAVTDFDLDGGPAPEFAHEVTPGLDTEFIPNGMNPYPSP